MRKESYDMHVEVQRYASGKRDTLGLFKIDCQFYAYTLEDEYRNVKEYGETRIPAGTYEIKLRTVGGFHERYKAKFPEMHKGMLELQNVPEFQYILIHIGNDEDDTAGCILVGNTANNNLIEGKKGFIGDSTSAYREVYPIIANKLAEGKKVLITIKDPE